MRVPVFYAWLLFVLAIAFPAHAEKRVALVIGNNVYDNLPKQAQLEKARNDAAAIGQSLSEVGFEVLFREDLTRAAFNTAWQEFIDKLEPGATALFYFAGHGVELSGRNYLIPRDVPDLKPGRDELLRRESLSLQEFLDDLREKGSRLNIVILDACRDNPFGKVPGRSLGGTRGLAVTEPPEGTFIMYSAGAGESALDRLSDEDKNKNSVYTRQLLPLLKKPGLTLTDVAEDVRMAVRDLALTAQHRQIPAYYNQVLGRMCLAGCETKDAPAASRISLDSVMNQCVRDPEHPAGAGIAARLAKELRPEDRQYGWYEETTNGSARTQVLKDVSSIEVVDGDLRINYDWAHGYLRLRAVAPQRMATRGLTAPGKAGDTPQFGSRFQGIWVQDNGYGCVELHFDPSGEAHGAWGIKTGSPDAEAFLAQRKHQDTPKKH